MLDATLSLVALIKLSKTPVYTINAGWAYSAAGLILMSGHKRYALPNTQCMIHSGSGGAVGSFEQVETQIQNYKQVVERMREFILSSTTINPRVFKKKQASDWFLTVEDMAECGIIDEVITDLDILF